MKLDYHSLHSVGTSGCGFNRDQLILLGVGYPPKRGWLRGLVGKEIPDQIWDRVCALRSLPKPERKKLRKMGFLNLPPKRA